MTATDWIAAALVVAGTFLGAVGGLGVLRFPDVFGRMHAATKPPTLGLLMVAAGAALRARALSDLGLLILVVLFQFLTAPVAAHLIGRAAYDSGGLLDEDTVLDELAGHDEDLSLLQPLVKLQRSHRQFGQPQPEEERTLAHVQTVGKIIAKRFTDGLPGECRTGGVERTDDLLAETF